MFSAVSAFLTEDDRKLIKSVSSGTKIFFINFYRKIITAKIIVIECQQ